MSEPNSIRNQIDRQHNDHQSPTSSTSSPPLPSFQVTPIHVALGGAAILLGGAFITGSAHYASTAKKLAEDGITSHARMKAMPIALQALGASTIACLGLGAAVAGAWHFAGAEFRSVANVSTLSEAITIAKQQRDILREEFRSKIFDDDDT